MRSLRKWLVVGVVIEWVAWLLILWSGGSPVGRALRLAVVCVVGSLTVATLRSWRSRWWPAAALSRRARSVSWRGRVWGRDTCRRGRSWRALPERS